MTASLLNADEPCAVHLRALPPGIEIAKPYLVYLGDVQSDMYAKTAFGLRDWAPADCIGQLREPSATVGLGLPDLTPPEAVARGARSLVIGLAPVGGSVSAAWLPSLRSALASGLDLVSGMHSKLEDVADLADLARRFDRRLVNLRAVTTHYPTGTGARRAGKRLLTIGTDCALGKKYTALAIARELAAQGVDATFRATGQTGILIAGAGIPIDAVVSDFVAGAAEALSPANAANHWDIIEGQGSLLHPAYAAVSLGLLHGSQPDAIVLCHDPRRTTIDGFPDFKIPSLREVADLNLTLGRRTNPAIRLVGVSLNTSQLTHDARRNIIAATEAELGVPCIDPIATGAGPIVQLLRDL